MRKTGLLGAVKQMGAKSSTPILFHNAEDIQHLRCETTESSFKLAFDSQRWNGRFFSSCEQTECRRPLLTLITENFDDEFSIV